MSFFPFQNVLISKKIITCNDCPSWFGPYLWTITCSMAFFSNALSRKPKCPKISNGQHQCSQWLEVISVNWASNESEAPSTVAAAVWTSTNVGHQRKEKPKKRKIKIEKRYKDLNKIPMTITTFASISLSFIFNKTGQQLI